MPFLLLIYEFRALPNSGDPKDTGQRDPPAQAQRGLIFPHGIVSGSLTSGGYLSLPVSSKPHASMAWDGMGAGEGKGGRGWFWSHFEHSGTGEDDPNIWIRFFLPPTTWITGARGKMIFQEVIARKE